MCVPDQLRDREAHRDRRAARTAAAGRPRPGRRRPSSQYVEDRGIFWERIKALPAFLLVKALIAGAPEGTRTPNLLIRRSTAATSSPISRTIVSARQQRSAASSSA